MPPKPKGKKAPPPPGSPFPAFPRPTPAECRAALAALESMHPGWQPSDGCDAEAAVASVMDCLVRTILSQNTTDATSMRAFVSMKAAFPDYGAVRAAPPAALAASIRAGGLADRKAAVIQALLAAVHDETGGTSLDHVRGWDAERVKSYLTAFDGVGPKTASCVLAFALGAADFPVDVHVHRAATAVLGWAPKAAGRDAVYHHLNARIPDDIKVRLHVLMVEHGKRCAACGGGRGGGEGAPGKAVAKCCLRSAVAAARAADRECGGGVKVEEQGTVPDPGLFSPQPAKKRRVKREEEEGAGGAAPPATTPAAGVAAPKTDASPVKPTRSLAGGGGGGGRARRRL